MHIPKIVNGEELVLQIRFKYRMLVRSVVEDMIVDADPATAPFGKAIGLRGQRLEMLQVLADGSDGVHELPALPIVRYDHRERHRPKARCVGKLCSFRRASARCRRPRMPSPRCKRLRPSSPHVRARGPRSRLTIPNPARGMISRRRDHHRARPTHLPALGPLSAILGGSAISARVDGLKRLPDRDEMAAVRVASEHVWPLDQG
jgi:hypothetical protein